MFMVAEDRAIVAMYKINDIFFGRHGSRWPWQAAVRRDWLGSVGFKKGHINGNGPYMSP